MSHTVACPACRANLKLPSQIPAGRRPRCPKCGESIALSSVVPNPAPSTPASNSPSGPSKPSADSSFAYLNPPEKEDELGRLGPYRILGVLGRGGMGTVFKAEDPTLRRTVALKVMLPQVAQNPTSKARFIREARAQAKVEHDHVITIHQVGEDRGIPYLAMPLLKGQTLGAVLKQTPRLPVPDLLRIGREVAEGLAAAHESGLVHRDIKPGNVWLEGNRQRVKILDFGLARNTAEGEGLMTADEPVTKAGAAVGTPAYMSPEQARALEVDHRTDLFSLGVVMYQMATGELPFRGADVMAVLTALALTDPVPPVQRNPELPPAVNALILRLLSKKPKDRPANGEAVVEELRQIEQSLLQPVPAAGYAPYITAPVVAVAPYPVSAMNDPWADIDATDTGVEFPPATVPVSNSSNPAVPAAPKTASHSGVHVAGGEGAPAGRDKAGLVLGAAIGLAGLLLVGGLAWLAVSIASTPKGTVAVDADNPEVELVLKGDEGEFRVKPGETNVPAGEYAVEFADAWKKSYGRGTQKLTVAPKGRGELKVRALPPPKPKEKPPAQPAPMPMGGT